MTSKKYEKIIAIATAVCIALLGVAFIICAAHLYFTGGEQPYSAERVGSYLRILAIPSIITVGLTGGGIVMRIISKPQDEEGTKRTHSEQLESYKKRFDLSGMTGERLDAVNHERRDRMIFSMIANIFSAAIYIYVLAYFIFVAQLTIEKLNDDMIRAFLFTLPLCAIALGVHIPRLYHAERSSKRELDAIREYVREAKPTRLAAPEKKSGKVDPVVFVRCALLFLSLGLIVLGVFNGGMKDVLAKAVKICTECIGLG